MGCGLREFDMSAIGELSTTRAVSGTIVTDGSRPARAPLPEGRGRAVEGRTRGSSARRSSAALPRPSRGARPPPPTSTSIKSLHLPISRWRAPAMQDTKGVGSLRRRVPAGAVSRRGRHRPFRRRARDRRRALRRALLAQGAVSLLSRPQQPRHVAAIAGIATLRGSVSRDAPPRSAARRIVSGRDSGATGGEQPGSTRDSLRQCSPCWLRRSPPWRRAIACAFAATMRRR